MVGGGGAILYFAFIAAACAIARVCVLTWTLTQIDTCDYDWRCSESVAAAVQSITLDDIKSMCVVAACIAQREAAV
jgi:hypothetical protein